MTPRPARPRGAGRAQATPLDDRARTCAAWPFEEARKLVRRLDGREPEKGYVLFETGYGPSGLPHIGTFGEVARTGMVRRAFSLLSDAPTRLFVFSDDMDGLRKAPDNVPNAEAMAEHLGRPLTETPNPFDTEHASFGDHNNAMLRSFLDRFGFDYEFVSATEMYRAGRFDETLLRVLERFDEVMEIVLPTLREERRRTYSPFMPISPSTGRVLLTPTLERDPSGGAIVFEDEDGRKRETPVTGGRCKLNWKPDWGMRWRALGVDYEMAGKDLIDSVRISGRICRALGGRPPEGFNYELFLDENGEKISKSRGNGLSIEEWLRYGTEESLSLFMYRKPRTAKRLHFDVIPQQVDDHARFLEAFDERAGDALDNPVWHVHGGDPPEARQPLSYAMLLNLAGVCNAEDKAVLWGFIGRYLPGATPETEPLLDRLAGLAVNYYRDVVKPARRRRAPTARERAAFEDLADRFAALPADADGETFQTEVYAVGREHGFEPLRAWFRALYEVLLGQDRGPRFGGFAALYGRDATVALMRRALACGEGAAWRRAARSPASLPAEGERDARTAARAAATHEELVRAFKSYTLERAVDAACVYDGNPTAHLMMIGIGVARGQEEDCRDTPFVGAAGELFGNMLADIGLDRDSVYITNMVYRQTPDNRTPTPEEVALCRPFLDRQIELIAPAVLVCIGGTAAKVILNRTEAIGRLHGCWFSLERKEREPIPATAIFHPAYFRWRPDSERETRRALLAIRNKLDELGVAPAAVGRDARP